MTKRELEILSLIKADPLIAQQKIADKLGISRSAVAGHIMHLTHKGVIRGKGYILAGSPYVVVLGGANMDILGRPAAHLRIRDSNPGSVSCSPGGVARNIAENLARLGSNTRLVTAVGNDAYGEMIIAQCLKAGVDMDNSLQVDDAMTSNYLSVLDEKADMHVAINDMAIMDRLRPEVLKKLEETLRRAELMVLDTNLSESALAFLLRNFSELPIFVDTVSCAKAMKIKPYLSAIHTIKPNLQEAQQLSGIEIHSLQELPVIADWFHTKGVRRIFLSLGAQGVFISDGEMRRLLPIKQVTIANVNGAGDAFLAGIVHGWLKQWSTRHATEFAMAAARLTLSDIATINPNMSERSVNRMIKESL